MEAQRRGKASPSAGGAIRQMWGRQTELEERPVHAGTKSNKAATGKPSIQECFRESDERVDVPDIGHQPERRPDGAGALAVDAEPEVVDRQMRLVLRLMEAR
jgi:hypothetical protein